MNLVGNFVQPTCIDSEPLEKSENPLRQVLGKYRDFSELAVVLSKNPLKGKDLSSLDFFQRDYLIDSIKDFFAPMSASLLLAKKLQALIHFSYHKRDLSNIENRRLRNAILAISSFSQATASAFTANAFMVSGCTGTGKTCAYKNYLANFPSSVVHQSSVAMAMERHVQIVYLIVPMQLTKAGLCLAILKSMDDATKDCQFPSSYFYQFVSKTLSVDKLELLVGHLLAQHNVGVLIIDEIQARNFSQSPSRDVFLVFLLGLLNFGTPIVFVGNPLGFVGLEDFSQDWRRLTTHDPVDFMPLEQSSKDWSRLATSLWSYDPLQVHEPYSSDSEIGNQLFLCGGGFVGYSGRSVQWASERLSIGISGSSSKIGAKQISEFRLSGQYLSSKNLIEGFVKKDPYLLMGYSDIPWETYGKLWNKITDEEIVAGPRPAIPVEKQDGEEAASKKANLSAHAHLRAKAQMALQRSKMKSSKNVPRILPTSDPEHDKGLASIEQMKLKMQKSSDDPKD